MGVGFQFRSRHHANRRTDVVGLHRREVASRIHSYRRYRIPRIVRIAEHGAHFRPEILVQTKQLFAPVRGLARGSVVEFRSGDTGVCDWDQRQQRRTGRADRNLVVREEVARRRIDRTIGKRTRRLIGTQVVEIAIAFRVRGHRRVKHLAGNALDPPLLGPEEERLLLVGVVVIRNKDRPAYRVSVIVLVVLRHSALEIVSGIERCVANELVGITVEAGWCPTWFPLPRCPSRCARTARHSSR